MESPALTLSHRTAKQTRFRGNLLNSSTTTISLWLVHWIPLKFPYCRKDAFRKSKQQRKAKAKVVSLRCESRAAVESLFFLISRDFHDLFSSQFPFDRMAIFNRLQLPATEQVMIIIRVSARELNLCAWADRIGSVKSPRLRFSGFQFIIFIAHMLRRCQLESGEENWINFNSLRKQPF